jgi:hypothetical protein
MRSMVARKLFLFNLPGGFSRMLNGVEGTWDFNGLPDGIEETCMQMMQRLYTCVVQDIIKSSPLIYVTYGRVSELCSSPSEKAYVDRFPENMKNPPYRVIENDSSYFK